MPLRIPLKSELHVVRDPLPLAGRSVVHQCSDKRTWVRTQDPVLCTAGEGVPERLRSPQTKIWEAEGIVHSPAAKLVTEESHTLQELKEINPSAHPLHALNQPQLLLLLFPTQPQLSSPCSLQHH